MKPFAVFTAVALLSCASGPSEEPGVDGRVPYAPVKTNARQIMPRGALTWTCRTRFPVRGVVGGYGGFMTSQADFYMVDIDAQTIRRIMIDREPMAVGTKILDPHKTVVWVDESAALTLDELNPLIRRMNKIWRNGLSDKPELQPMDFAPALVLLDENLAFNDAGTSNHAPDKVLSNALFDLVLRHKLNVTRGVSTGKPCDPAR